MHLVMARFGSELWFEPNSFRTELIVQFKVHLAELNQWFGLWFRVEVTSLNYYIKLQILG